MKRVAKFDLPIRPSAMVMLPAGAQVLGVVAQGGEPRLLALIDDDKPLAPRCFHVVGTGVPMTEEPGRYVGTVALLSGGMDLHVFEEATS